MLRKCEQREIRRSEIHSLFVGLNGFIAVVPTFVAPPLFLIRYERSALNAAGYM